MKEITIYVNEFFKMNHKETIKVLQINSSNNKKICKLVQEVLHPLQ